MSQATSSSRDLSIIPLDQSQIDTPVDSTSKLPLILSSKDPVTEESPLILPSQKRLAEITEMIHTASLLHDDVIDVSPTRRSRPVSPVVNYRAQMQNSATKWPY
jgi:hexaprenyl-diphosphate synthase